LYYGGGIGVVNGVNWGRGFYFDDTDPGTTASDNYGDYCSDPTCTWTFCWNQTVSAACTPGASLAVTVNTSGDGESGSWGSSACTDDNATNFSAIQICCTAPTMAAVPVTCIGDANGSVTATHGTGASPWDYVWTNSSGTNVGTTMNSAAASNTVSGLVAGTYTVTITDNLGCVTSNTVVVGPGVSCACLMNLFTTNIGFCQPNNTFPVNGTFSYTNAPATGTIVVIVTNSSGTYTQTFNPPFVNGTVYNYNITNCISDGSASTVQVYFTATPSCQQLLTFTSPISCLCTADIGTFTADIIGVSNNNYILCYGDVIDIQTNNDWTGPGIATSPPGPTYDVGVSWLIYSCPPTIGLVPSATQDVANDPCLLGIVSDYDLNDLNDQGMLSAFPAGTFSNNTIYYVPITMYSIVSGTYSYVNTTIPCYDLGTPYAVQYLPQITSTFVQSCTTVTATISGGLPAINGSQFTAVAGSLTPANASFGNTTCSNGGTIAINGLTAGQVFTFQVQDANGCPKTVTGTFTGPPTLTYPSATYCKNGANPSPTVVGVAGGTYTSTAGLVFVSAATGVINLTTSTAGTYTVTYTTPAVPGPVCTATFVITINPLPIIAVPDQTVCAGTAVTLSGNGATTYTWTGGVTNGVAFTPAATATYTVTGTITATGCTNTDPATITVNPLPIVGAGVDQTVCAGVAVTLSGSGASTYTWNNGVTNGVAFTPAATATYTVTGTSAAGCINTDQVVVTVNPIPVVSAGPDASICTGGSTTLTASGATTYSWAPGGQLTAAITVSPVATTTYTVTGTSLGCTASDAVTVTILANAPINAGLDVAICIGASTTLTATGGVTYAWDNGLGIGNNFVVSPLVTTTYTVVGTNAGGCTGTDAMTVTVNPLPIVGAGVDQTVCAGTAVTLSGSGASTYTWNNGVTNAVAFTPIATNTYTVTGTDANGCVNTDQVLVTINPIPVVGAGPDQAICIGASVTLSGSGAATYTWDNGVTNGTAFAPIATTTYTVTGTTAAGCTSTDQVIVTVNPLPVVNAGADQAICIGASVTLNGAGASTYTWTNGVTNGVAFTPAVGTLTYTVTGTSAAGCISTDQVDVLVNPLPIVAAGPDQIVCAGTAVTLTASGAATYTWNNGITDGVAFTPLATTTYTVTGTSVAGCVNTDQVLVTVNPIPVVFAGTDVPICANQTVTLTGSGAATYTWNNGITNGIAFNPPVGTTTYTVTGTTAAGCINTDQVVVTVNPIPVVSFTPDVTFGCVPLTVNFTNTTPNTASGVWTMSDGTVLTGGGTVTNTFTQAGCFDITLTTTSTNGCVGTFTAIDLICTEAAPIASFSPSASVISELNPIVDFNNTTTGAVDYIWNFGDNTPNSVDVNPTHDYSNDAIGNYIVTLIAYSPFGCVDTAYSTIQIYEELIFYVPNTFTPDNDDYNPTFQPIFTSGYDPYDYTLLIFNRWGEIVFESHNTEIGWDGTYGGNHEVDLVQDGTYTWKIEFKTNRNDERVMRVGHVNILR
jgi:gliding motility-associated-like protein